MPLGGRGMKQWLDSLWGYEKDAVTEMAIIVALVLVFMCLGAR